MDQANTIPSAPNALCPDQTSDVPGTPQECIAPHGGGRGHRMCTDRVTMHFVPLIDTDGKRHCVFTGSTVTTSCDDTCIPDNPPAGGGLP